MDLHFVGSSVLQFCVAMVATICFSLAFQVPRRHFLACGITGAVGWVVYFIATAAGLSVPAATLVAALPLTGVSRLFAITRRAPVTLFLLCGIFPLVPGAGIYYTAYAFITGDTVQCAAKGAETLKIAVALAMGIAMVMSIPLKPSNLRRDKR